MIRIPRGATSVLAVDCVGAAVALVFAGSAAWFGVFQANRASVRIEQFSEQNGETRAVLADLRRALDYHMRRAQTLDTELQQSGSVPESVSVERDLQLITDFARSRNLDVLGVAPRSSVRYPSLTEVRYGLSCAGSFQDLLAFLDDFERSAIWGEISYMQIDAPAVRSVTDLDERRTADFTVSLYSSAGSRPAPEGAPQS